MHYYDESINMSDFRQHDPNKNSEKFAKAICFAKPLCEFFALDDRHLLIIQNKLIANSFKKEFIQLWEQFSS